MSVAPVLAGGGAPACAATVRAQSGELVIPVVVDTSTTVEVTCVPAPAGSTGSQVLVLRAQLLGRPVPRYNDSGLLCAIDGYPATGCGTLHGGRYAYWAYFHGGSSWQYANGGPAAWTVFPGDVEGWRFEPNGAGAPTDPPPRAESLATALCPASATTTTSTVPPTTSRRAGGSPTTTAGTARRSGAGLGAGSGGGGMGGATGKVASGPASGRSLPGAAAANVAGKASRSTHPKARRARATGKTGGPAPGATAVAAQVPTTAPAGAAAGPAGTGSTGGGSAAGTVKVLLVAAVIALLAVAAVVRGRRGARGRD